MPREREGNVLLGLIIDESGSMYEERDRVIDSYNEFIGDVSRQDGERVAVVTQFSESFGNGKSVRMGFPKRVSALRHMRYSTYNPGGGTPLFDAIGTTISRLDKEYNKLNDGCCSKCGNWTVLVMIQTDGLENASREFNRHQISKMIREREERGWKFIYAGVDQDKFTAERQAQAMGMSVGSTYSISRAGGVGYRAETATLAATQPHLNSAQLASFTQKAYDEEGVGLGNS